MLKITKESSKKYDPSSVHVGYMVYAAWVNMNSRSHIGANTTPKILYVLKITSSLVLSNCSCNINFMILFKSNAKYTKYYVTKGLNDLSIPNYIFIKVWCNDF